MVLLLAVFTFHGEPLFGFPRMRHSCSFCGIFYRSCDYTFDIDWVLYCVITLVLGMATLAALKCRREIQLLRNGEVTMAHIDSREDTAEWQDDRIHHHFMTAGGVAVSGRALYTGYGVLEGSSVPVFYDANNPRDHIAACASWFEAD